MRLPELQMSSTKSSNWYDNVKTSTSELSGKFQKTMLISAVVFGIWGMFFPISSAVIAPGKIIREGSNTSLQHPVGGSVVEILAQAGDRVEAGQLLYRLDPNGTQAELTSMRARQSNLLALKARMEAEKSFHGEDAEGEDLLRGSASTIDLASLSTDSVLFREQRREYIKGRETVSAQLKQLEKQRQSFETQMQSTQDRLEDLKAQIKLMEEQFAAVSELVKAGHMARQNRWDMETQLLSLRSQRTEMKAQITSLRNSIEGTDAEIERVIKEDERGTSEKLTSVLTELMQLEDSIKASQSSLNNLNVKATVSGTLVHTKVHNVGAVVKPAETFAEVVPENAAYEFEAILKTQDITHLQPGQEARVSITGLNPKIYDKLPAEVVYIAADTQVDPQTRNIFYNVRLRLKNLPSDPNGILIIRTGMSGEAYIMGEKRSFFSYLFEPILTSLSQSFVEH